MIDRLPGGLLSRKDLADHKEEINRENRIAIHLFSIAGFLVSVVNAITQATVRGDVLPPLHAFFMPAFFIVLILLDRFVLPHRFEHSVAVMYAVQGMVMIDAILLGTILDRNHQATTILLLLMFMPAFVMDLPIRSAGINGFWCLLFLYFCKQVKEPSLYQIDLIHTAEFYIASLILTYAIMRVRLNYVRKISETSYIIDHDPQTGCYSRDALGRRSDRYIGMPVVIVTAVIENLTMLSDFMGNGTASNIMVYFSTLLSSTFGEENTYRYRGNEFFCVLRNRTEEECRIAIDQIRRKMEGYELDGHRAILTASFSYVTGTAKDEETFRQMAQLADIYLHKAGKSGNNQTCGGSFSPEKLREGIVESNLFINAKSYEINSLTGLPDVSYFTVHATELLDTIVDRSRHPMIGYVKLMRMRRFNNAFGYSRGDTLIADTAKLLVNTFKNRQICYVTAGKFCVMCYKDEIEPALTLINEALEAYQPGFGISVIAGFAEYTGSESVISLIDRAKLAEKSIRKKNEVYLCYDQEMDEKNELRQYLLNHVDEAIENEYLKVYYQPIARALTGKVCNEEALSRWDDPKYGFLMPNKFVPVLEESAQMFKVNLFVVSKVLEDFAERKRLGVPIVPVSVNLSRSDFEQCDMVSGITAMVDEAGVSHDMIKIEITESAFMDDEEILKREVARFRANGFEVWLDDFGSEYSTLNLLQEIDFDLLKIDMQFMKNFSTTGKNFIIISDIIDMAKRMGVTTLIEGIETTEHYEILQKLGCEKIQGYLFNRPNSQEYIIKRAQSGTGLTFETPEEAPYYEAIGRIDLRKPANRDMDGTSESDIPSSVLEWHDGAFTCLAATEPFLRIMASLGLMKEGDSDRSVINPPADMIAAAEKCDTCKKRLSFTITTDDSHRYTVFMRRISDYTYQGAVALLTTILQTRSE